MFLRFSTQSPHSHQQDAFFSQVKTLIEKESYSSVEKILLDLKSENIAITPKHFSLLMKGFIRKGKLKMAENLLETMEKMGTKPNSFHYNILLKGCFQKEKFSHVEKILQKMQENGIEIDDVTKTILLNGYALKGKLRKAEEIFASLEKPNIFAFNSLFHGYMYYQETKKGMKLFERMIQEGIRPDIYTYTTLIHHSSTSDFPKIIEEMKTNGIEPDIKFYNAMMDRFTKQGKYKEAIACIDEMQMNNATPDFITHALLMKCLVGMEEIERAEKILNTLKQKFGGNLSNHIFAPLIGYYARCGKDANVLQLIKDMEELGIKMSKKTLRKKNELQQKMK